MSMKYEKKYPVIEQDLPRNPTVLEQTVNAMVGTRCSNFITSTPVVAHMHLQQLMDRRGKLASCVGGDAGQAQWRLCPKPNQT